jgi:hypothetical protein
VGQERLGPSYFCISVKPSKQPLMVRTVLKVYMELISYFLFLQEQIKDIIITCAHAIPHENVENQTPVFDSQEHSTFAILSGNIRKHIWDIAEMRKQLHAHKHHVVTVSQTSLAVVVALCKHISDRGALDFFVSMRAM